MKILSATIAAMALAGVAQTAIEVDSSEPIRPAKQPGGGVERARVRLAEKRKANATIPDVQWLTRQQHRAEGRALAKRNAVSPAEAARRAMDARKRFAQSIPA